MIDLEKVAVHSAVLTPKKKHKKLLRVYASSNLEVFIIQNCVQRKFE